MRDERVRWLANDHDTPNDDKVEIPEDPPQELPGRYGSFLLPRKAWADGFRIPGTDEADIASLTDAECRAIAKATIEYQLKFLALQRSERYHPPRELQILRDAFAGMLRLDSNEVLQQATERIDAELKDAMDAF